MVEELLEFSKMEDGRFTLHMEQVDLQAEFEDAIFTYRELFRQEGIELTYEGGDEDLPPIPGDSERLKQVFCNVLDNAAKHGGSGRRIDASISREGEFVVVRVRDYGPGIRRRSCPSSSRNSTRAPPRPGAAASAWRCAMRSWASTTASLPSAMPLAAARWSPSACR